MNPRRSVEEKLEFQRKLLQDLAKHPEGITFKALLKNALGSVPKTGGSFSFLRFWRGEGKPLIVKLTEFQAQKLGLKVVGFDEYSVKSRGKRVPIFFHPEFERLYDVLKPYEDKSAVRTPTRAGLEAEISMKNMVESSSLSVEKTLQAIRGIELSFLCPHCGKPIKFIEVGGKTQMDRD